MIEEEFDGKLWFCDIKTYLQFGECPSDVNSNKKRTIRRIESGFFLSGWNILQEDPRFGSPKLCKCSRGFNNHD